jgi:zinc transport system substrate-binding protein
LKSGRKLKKRSKEYPMRHSAGLLGFFLTLMFFSSCTRQNQTDDVQITVATSIFPIYDIVQHIAGERAEVHYVIPVGANPHHYEPLPATVIKLQRVNLFIGIHSEFDGWILDILPEKANILFLLPEDGSHCQTNPHIWLTPGGGMRIATAAARILSSSDPQNKAYYQQNLQSYLRELSILDSTLTSLFDRISCRTFIQWHPAWDYLARDYGLTVAATIEHGHGDEPSVKEFKQLIDTAKRNNIKLVVIGLHAESKATEALVAEIDGTLLRLDTIGDPACDERATYIKMMQHNAILLSTALDRAAMNTAVSRDKP